MIEFIKGLFKDPEYKIEVVSMYAQISGAITTEYEVYVRNYGYRKSHRNAWNFIERFKSKSDALECIERVKQSSGSERTEYIE